MLGICKGSDFKENSNLRKMLTSPNIRHCQILSLIHPYTSPALPPVYIQNSHPSSWQRLLQLSWQSVGLVIQGRGFDSQPEALELHFAQLVPVGFQNVCLPDTRMYLALKSIPKYVLMHSWTSAYVVIRHSNRAYKFHSKRISHAKR